MIGLRLGKKCEHARGNVAAAGEQKGPTRASVLCGLQRLFHKEGQEGYVCASCGHQDADCIDCLASSWWLFGCTQLDRSALARTLRKNCGAFARQ